MSRLRILKARSHQMLKVYFTYSPAVWCLYTNGWAVYTKKQGRTDQAHALGLTGLSITIRLALKSLRTAKKWKHVALSKGPLQVERCVRSSLTRTSIGLLGTASTATSKPLTATSTGIHMRATSAIWLAPSKLQPFIWKLPWQLLRLPSLWLTYSD